MSTRISGRLELTATALDALHHGAGTSGNTQLLRVQDIVHPVTGLPARVPFISGNSFKHRIRDAGVRFALAAMGVDEGTLTKPQVDLLFSGGSLSKTGSAVNLEHARQIERLFPALSLCGYSAGNTMQPSKIRVDNLHLVCAENDWRVPDGLRELPSLKHRAALYRGEAFGTRHEPTRQAHVARLLTAAESERLDLAVSKKQTVKTPEKGDSQQMIYDFEVVKPGAVFWGAVHLDDLSELEGVALRSALSFACDGVHADGRYLYRLGAKNSIGYGRVAVTFTGALREGIRPPDFRPGADLVPAGQCDPALDAYRAHLRSEREAILGALAGVLG